LARRSDISPKTHAAVVQRFRQFSADRLSLETLHAADFERAAAWLEVYRIGLRSGDALHLALCARRGAALATADQRMLEAATVLEIRTARI